MKYASNCVGGLALVATILLPIGQAAAVIISFQQDADGYTGVEDTFVSNLAHQNLNFGGRPNFDVGARYSNAQELAQPARALLRFDVTSLATQFSNGFTVNSATLRLLASGDASFPGRFLELRLLADENAAWVEGNSNGFNNVPPPNGESTWRRRNTYDPTTDPQAILWAGSPGAGTSGVDYDPTVLASKEVNGIFGGLQSEGWGDFDLVMNGDLSFFNTWASGGTNAGFFLKMDDENVTEKTIINFFSSQLGSSPDPHTARPELILDITPNVGQPGDFDGDADVDGADFLLWQRTSGDATELGVWGSNFGTPSEGTAATQAVPEPTSLLLLTLAALGLRPMSTSKFRLV